MHQLYAGGSLPTVQDAVAHADAALHLLQKTVGQESWLTASTAASVRKKSAELQVSHHYNLNILCQCVHLAAFAKGCIA